MDDKEITEVLEDVVGNLAEIQQPVYRVAVLENIFKLIFLRSGTPFLPLPPSPPFRLHSPHVLNPFPLNSLSIDPSFSNIPIPSTSTYSFSFR